MKPGKVVFFKRARTSPQKHGHEVQFHGHGFALMLGESAPFQPDPNALRVTRCLGTLGLLTFDDVTEFLGEEAANECVKKFEDKYYPQPVAPKEEEVKNDLPND